MTFAKATPATTTTHEQIFGLELCDDLFDFFSSQYTEQDFFLLQKKEIVAAGKNNFPYNITLHFPATTRSPQNKNSDNFTYLQNHLLICFTMRDAYAHKNALATLIDFIKTKKYNFAITILLSYETENYPFVSGNFSYVSTLDESDFLTALCISFNSAFNSAGKKIMPVIFYKNSFAKKTAPKKLLEIVMQSFYQTKTKFFLNRKTEHAKNYFWFESQKRFSDFLKADVPSVLVLFADDADTEQTLTKLISTFIENYEKHENSATEKYQNYEWEKHYFVAHGKDFYIFDETEITIFATITIFILIFLFVFVWQKKLKRFFRFTKKSLTRTFIKISIIIFIFLLIICVTKIISHKQKQSQMRAINFYANAFTETQASSTNEDIDKFIAVKITDQKTLEGVIRTLEINLQEEVFLCNVEIETKGFMPIVFSENEFISDATNQKANFVIPPYPPKNLTFSYIALSEESEIKITAKKNISHTTFPTELLVFEKKITTPVTHKEATKL